LSGADGCFRDAELSLGGLELAIRFVELAFTNVDAVFPQRAYGLWLAALGLIVLSRAVYDIRRERRL